MISVQLLLFEGSAFYTKSQTGLQIVSRPVDKPILGLKTAEGRNKTGSQAAAAGALGKKTSLQTAAMATQAKRKKTARYS